MKSFTIEIHMEESLTVDEIWPDGDAPENPTAEDVKKVFVKGHEYNIHSRCADWGFEISKDDVIITDENADELLRMLDEAKKRAQSQQDSSAPQEQSPTPESPSDGETP